MSVNQDPTVHGPISAEQAEILANADTPAAKEIMKLAGITDPDPGDVISVADENGETSHYVTANVEDAGTIIAKRTANKVGLPDLTKPAGSGLHEYGGYTHIVSHQPGTVYETGMPLPLDVDTNPQTGHPQVPNTKPGSRTFE